MSTEALRHQRAKMLTACKNIGEPVVEFPNDKMGVVIRDGQPHVYVSMKDLIEFIDGLEAQ